MALQIVQRVVRARAQRAQPAIRETATELKAMTMRRLSVSRNDAFAKIDPSALKAHGGASFGRLRRDLPRW
jgi:hypothetical protein